MLLTVLLYLVVAIVVALTGRTFGSRVFWVRSEERRVGKEC